MSNQLNGLLQQPKSQTHETPQWLFDELHREFRFTWDVCATHLTAKCWLFYTPKDDALQKVWRGRCWMNPPYGRTSQIANWLWCAREAVGPEGRAQVVVCLLPSRTSTKWWQEHVIPHASEIRYIHGRLKFKGQPYNAPFDSAIVIYRPVPSYMKPKSER